MNTHDIQQGTAQWHEYRATRRNASDTPAVLGCSPYKTRDQLIKERATGLKPEVSAHQQRIFDAGHAAESAARAAAEEVVFDDLFPVVGSSDIWSASFDGLTMDGKIGWEHKFLNKDLRVIMMDIVDGRDLPLHYRAQMEHQLMVCGGEKILFTASRPDEEDGTKSSYSVWYHPDPALREQIIRAWDQFDADVAAYTHAEAPAKVVAEPVESLPAVSVRVDGKLTIASNLDLFTAKLRAYIESLPKKPETDQDFANAEAATKSLQQAQDACEREAQAMLAPFTDAEAARRALADAAALCRTTRLALEKLVKERKESIKSEIAAEAMAKFRSHIDALDAKLGSAFGRLMPAVPIDLQTAVKNKRTVESLRNAVNSELAFACASANAVHATIEGNLRLLNARNAAHLFPDLKLVCAKAGDDFAAILDQRVAVEEQRLERERQSARAEAIEQVSAAQQAIERARSTPQAVDAVKAPDPVRATEQTRAAVVEHQDEISRFLATVNATAKEKNTIRAYLVQFVAFQARESQVA